MSRYGIISGITHPLQAQVAGSYFKRNRANAIILNGDLSSGVPADNKLNHLHLVFGALARTKLPILIQPGIEEQLWFFEPSIFNAMKKYPNIMDIRDTLEYTCRDHQLIFVPGVEFEGSEYVFGNELSTGIYENNNNQWIKKNFSKNKTIKGKLKSYTNLKDISDLIIEPERTIFISNYSREFNNDQCIDKYVFIRNIYQNSITPMPELQNPGKLDQHINQELLNDGEEYFFSTVGSPSLKKFFKDNNITKSVASNATYNNQQAHTSKGKLLSEKNFNSNIHYNTGRMRFGQAGMIFINENNMKYENIDLGAPLNLVRGLF